MDDAEEIVREVEIAASAAAEREDFVRRRWKDLWSRWWPNWTPGNARRRFSNQLQTQDDRNPLQVRLLVELLLDTGDDEILGLLRSAHRIGQARSARRESERLQRELERTRVRRVSPGGRLADVG